MEKVTQKGLEEGAAEGLPKEEGKSFEDFDRRETAP